MTLWTRACRRARAAVLAVLGLVAPLAGEAGAQVRGLITGPGETAFPIAVPAAAAGGEAGRLFTTTLTRDLDLAGMFRILDPASFIEQGEGTRTEEINFGNWSTIGARLLVTSRAATSGDELTIEARLFDVAEQRQLGGKRYQGSARDARRMANRFADEILLVLTGELGPFDTRIAFVSTRSGRFKELYSMSFDGSELRQLTRNQTINLSPSWAPDARSVIFTSYKDGRPKLYEIDVVTGRERLIPTGPGMVMGASFAPDGREIAVTRSAGDGDSDIVLVSPEGQILSRLTQGQTINVSPSFSPDGSQIAFCSGRGGSPQIYVMGTGGGQPRRVSSRGSYNTQPVWSPKGDRIAYTGRVDGRFQIFVVDAGGGEALQVTSSRGDNVDPTWSPDGRYLIFSSTRAGKAQLYFSDARGVRQRQLISSPGSDSSPAWSPRLD
ncbi:MAG: Tol-Pal system beta propeller repeat protein TolB [Thermodesulfobacteriota bacterium]